jgi:hypothetical protein
VTTTFVGQTFSGLRDSPPKVIEDIELNECRFDRCALSNTFDVAKRSHVKRVVLRNCAVGRVSIGGAALEDVTFDGLKTERLVQTWSAVFRHVILRGRIGRVMTSSYVEPIAASTAQQSAYDAANRTFYAETDWAVDVTEADAEELELAAVPGRLVRFDERDGALITREVAQRGEWRKLDLSGTWWDIAIQDLANSQLDSVVLVAPRRHRSYRTLVDGIHRLKDAGIAQP